MEQLQNITVADVYNFFNLGVTKVHFLNVLYTLWLIRFLYWTHSSPLYFFTAFSLWVGTLLYYKEYFLYVWYLFFLQVLITLWRVMLDQYYARKKEEFEGLECLGTQVTKTHLQPEKMIFKGKEYIGKEEMMKCAGVALRSMGFKDMNITQKKQFCFAFVHQHLLSHQKIDDESGFCSENASFSLLNPFSPVFIPPSVENSWFSEKIQVKGWTCFKKVNPRNGFVTFFRAYHKVIFGKKGDIESWEVVRFF